MTTKTVFCIIISKNELILVKQMTHGTDKGREYLRLHATSLNTLHHVELIFHENRHMKNVHGMQWSLHAVVLTY